jgi:sugar lactone lactonase YvrE
MTFAMNPDPEESENRFNDGKCDRDGRIWAGRTHDPETKATGWLYRIDPDLSHSKWDGPYICPNGPAISPDDSTLYHVDTFGGTVWAFDKHPDGTISDRREFARLDSKKEGFPDGLTVDNENRVWLAHWGGSRVTCFSPHGERIGTVQLPVPQVTSCTFGGPDLSTLYITTAARNLNFDEYPLAGALFRVPTKTTGSSSPAFAG